jgi:integration host factor subunit beta
MATRTKKDLIDSIAEKTGQNRAGVRRVVQLFLDGIVDEVSRGNRIEFREFGVFEIRDRAPRVAQNPKTLQRVTVPAKRVVRFKPGRLMRKVLDAAPAQPAAGRRARTLRVEVPASVNHVLTRT